MSPFSAMVSGSVSTAMSASDGGTTCMFLSSSITSSVMKPWRPLMPRSV